MKPLSSPPMGLRLSSTDPISLGPPSTPGRPLSLPFIQGPPGAAGKNGQDGLNGRDGTNGSDAIAFPGFGQITYSHTPVLPGDLLLPNTPTALSFTSDPPQDKLLGVFTGHVFWNGSRIVPRAMNDLIEVQVNLQISSQIAGGFIQVYLDAGSVSGPIVSSTATLFSPANTVERVTCLLNFQVLSNIMTNGAAVYLRSTVPVYVVKESLLLMPRSTQG